MNSSINDQEKNKKEKIGIMKNEHIINNKGQNKNQIKSMINIKYLNDYSFTLFDSIFRNIEFEDINNENIKINCYDDFYNFQINLNSYYKSSILDFEYKNKDKVSIIKEMPYKPTKLRTIYEEDSEIIIPPNGIFAKTLIKENQFESSLSHYITIIGNSIIINDIYYYELQILSLGEDTDLYVGIISKDSLNFKKYMHFPIPIYKDSYSLNLNNHYEFEDSNRKYLIKEGDIINVKIDLINKYVYFYINNKRFKNNKIPIKFDNIIGYYPAFSLSSDKEIQVNFGGDYTIKYKKKGNKIDEKPISKYKNLGKIVICYKTIIENILMKIINYPQISYNDSLRFFYPMLNFFGKLSLLMNLLLKNIF